MYESKLDEVIHQDVNRVKSDLNTLTEDGVKKASRVADDLDRTTENVADWVSNGVSHLSSEFEKVKDDATKTVADAKKTVAHASTKLVKNVGNGLSEYNAKAEEVVNKLPGDIGVKAGEYPWVSITFALLAGFLLRSLLMPRRILQD